MSLSRSDVETLVKKELASIKDEVVLDALKAILVEPSIRHMDWDYGSEGQTYPCWTVAQNEEYDTALVYCEFGFGPESPWGLVWLSRFNNMGTDSGWFVHLEDAFCESFIAADLKIWDLVKKNAGDTQDEGVIVETSLTTDGAFERLGAYRAQSMEKAVYHIRRRRVQS